MDSCLSQPNDQFEIKFLKSIPILILNNATPGNTGPKFKGAAAGPVYITHSRLDDNYLEPLNRHVLS